VTLIHFHTSELTVPTVMVFIFTFAVFGGSGKAHPFPIWAGNPDTSVHNLDYCMVNQANGG